MCGVLSVVDYEFLGDFFHLAILQRLSDEWWQFKSAALFSNGESVCQDSPSSLQSLR